jgi:hypothetical protein
MARTELERLRSGPDATERPGGIGTVRIVAKCSGNAQEVLSRTKQAMEVVARVTASEGKEVEIWKKALPSWLVSVFRPQPTRAEIEAVLKLSLEGKQKWGEQNWDLESWLHWFRPENRYWYWWDAEVRDENTLVVAIEVSEWPFPWGALKWLLKAAGATSVEAEE